MEGIDNLDRVLRQPMDRRGVLELGAKFALLAAGGRYLAACGGEGEPAGPITTLDGAPVETTGSTGQQIDTTTSLAQPDSTLAAAPNPGGIKDRVLYNDPLRDVRARAESARASGDIETADALDVIGAQPGVTWLHGANSTRGPEVVARTSAEANSRGELAVYQLFGIPDRDFGAGTVGEGFADGDRYIEWVHSIASSVQGDSLFLIEADAIAHAISSNKSTPELREHRYALLSEAVTILGGVDRVLGTYLDAAHPGWFPEPSALADALFKSGIENASGIAANVSNYHFTDTTIEWSGRLLAAVDPSGTKQAVIDTSRNGNGAEPPKLAGNSDWCNRPEAGLGPNPTTSDLPSHVAALLWVKIIEESDNNIDGCHYLDVNVPPGGYSPELARSLVANRPQG